MTDIVTAIGIEGVRRPKVHRLFSGTGTVWLLVPPIALLALLLVVPLAFLFEFALVDSGFDQAFENEIFRDSLVRTLLMASVVSFLSLVIGTLFALAISLASRWVGLMLVIALFSLFWTSILVRSYGWLLLYLPKGPLYTVLHGLGLRDDPVEVFQTTYAPYPAMVHVMLPYVVLPVWAAIRQLDPDQLRAARVLGAGPVMTLRKVVLPQLRAGIVAGGVLVFVMSLGFYVTPQMLGSPSTPTVAGMIGWAFGTPDRLPLAAAMSIILLGVVVVIYLVADRLFKVSEQWAE